MLKTILGLFCVASVISLIFITSAQANSVPAQQVGADVFTKPMILGLGQDSATTQACKEESTENEGIEESNGYRQVDDMFNVREANPDVMKNEWEVEFQAVWATFDHRHDQVTVEPSIKYGITDKLFLELEVLSLEICDSSEGNGDLNLVLFNQFVKECGLCPAIAGWAEMRIPSGKDSSGVDGTLHLNVTKSITDKFRTHMEGFVETANGAQGGDDEDRRHFQWGVGPGFDYLLSCKTIAVLNYLNRSSEEYGHHNSNILEFGVAHSLTKSQTIKGALDVGLDGQEETPNLGVKLQWSYDW